MSCTLRSVKGHTIDKAMDVFQGGALSIRLNKMLKTATIRWGREFKVKTREQAFNMVQAKMKAVDKWAQEQYKLPHRGWVTLDGQTPDSLTVKFRMPESLEKEFVKSLARNGDQESIDKIAKNPYYYDVKDSAPSIDSDIVFQLDNKKAAVKKGLDRIVKRFFKDNGITMMDMKEYERIYGERFGKTLDAVALSNIMENLVAFSESKKDGTTLLEEAIHFVVFHAWETNAFYNLTTMVGEDGVRWIENSPEYLAFYDQYKTAYKDKLGRDNWQTLVDQEIVTKIVTNYIYNEYRKGTYSNPNAFQRALLRVTRFIRGLFPKAATQTYLKEIENELSTLGKDFITGKINLSGTQEKIGNYLDLVPESGTNIVKLANDILNRLKLRRTKLSQNARQLFNTQIKKYKKELEEKYSITDLDLLKEQIDILLDNFNSGTITREDNELLNELLDLEDLFKRDKEDREVAKKIKEAAESITIINTQIKTKQYQRAIKFFIQGATFFNPETDEYETKNSVIDDANDIIQKLMEEGDTYDPNSRTLAFPLFIKAKDFYDNFNQAILDLNSLLLSKNNKGINIFDELNESEAQLLREDIQRASETFNRLNNQINTFWRDIVAEEIADRVNTDSSNEKIFKDINPKEMATDPQFDISLVTKYIGSMTNMAPWQIQGVIKAYSEILNRVNNNTRIASTQLVETVLKHRKNGLDNNRVIRELLDKYGLTHFEQLIMEMSDGKPTGYYLNEYNLGKWKAAQEKAAEEILNKLERFMKNELSITYRIPRGDSPAAIKARNKFLYEDSLKYLSTSGVSVATNPIVNFYKKQWKDWYEKHTQPHPNADAIVKERSETLSSVEFEVWYKENHYEYTAPDGSTIMYPAGELVIPSNIYTNPDAKRLAKIPEFVEFHNLYVALKEESDNKLPVYITSSYEFRYRLPQISVDSYDIVGRVFQGKFKGLWDNLKEVSTGSFIVRPDDSISLRNANEDITIDGSLPSVYTPPIRFTKKLENPQNLTKDVIGAMMIYFNMAENYSEISRQMPYFQALREATSRADFRQYNNKTIRKDKTYVEDVIDKFFTTALYGQRLQDVSLPWFGGSRLSITKLSETLAKWKRDINLKMNYPAMASGYVDATKNHWIERLTGRNITKDSANWAYKYYYTHLDDALRDYESPIKTSPITLLGQMVHVQDSNNEVFKDTDKNRALNMLARSSNYGTWRFADYGLRMKTMLAVMDNYRFIDGKWYTREEWLQEEKSMETWKANRENSFFNKATNNGKLNNGKLVQTDIKDADWNFLTNRIKLLNRDISTQKSDLDSAYFDHTLLGTWVMMHKAFLRLGLEKRFKRRHRNFVTQKWEEGNHRWLIDLGKSVYRPDSVDINAATLINWHDLRPEQKEGVINTVVSIIWANLSFALGVAIARTIDDDEDDPFMQFLQYTALRNYQESVTFLGPMEFVNIVLRPIPGVDLFDSLAKIIPALINNEELKNSPYDTKLERAVIKSLPYYRGYHETFPADVPASNSGKALLMKKRYLDNQVINATSPVAPGAWFIDFEE